MLQRVSRYSEQDRAYLGLPQIDNGALSLPSVEVSGAVTDKHKLVAAELFGVPYETVTAQQRQQAKEASLRHMYRW